MHAKHSPIVVFMQNHRLSPQEMRVVDGALRELCNEEIAHELGCSASTVRTYWARVLGVESRRGRCASHRTDDAGAEAPGKDGEPA
jgi:DNA-binding CsgD family transcriptional regulator